jgi:ABC-type lipoprotein export system ATPase subunit
MDKMPLFDGLISVSFKTSAAITDRTVVVAEAFGLGIDEEKEFVVYDRQPLTINTGDVVYITGDSGGGKSALLRHLYKKISQDYGVISLNTLMIDGSDVLIDSVGRTVEEALEILARAGLGDAFLMLRQYSQLSDGQAYRYRIARMIDTNLKVWMIDEFCATLDRETAKVIAYSIQKLARKLGVTLIVATTHTDLEADLNPDVLVQKSYGASGTVEHRTITSRKFSMLDDIKYELGTYNDYEQSGLAAFHYKNEKAPVALRSVYSAKLNGIVIGALITRYPMLESQERNFITNKRYVRNYKQLNEEVEVISRVVITPKFRGIGLGAEIVRNYLNSPYAKSVVETMAVMARYNPFFERAGMQRVMIMRKTYTAARYRAIMELLRALHFDVELITSTRYNLTKLEILTAAQLSPLVNLLMREYSRVSALHSTGDAKGRQATKELIQTVLQLETYSKSDLQFLAETIKKIKRSDLAYYIYFNDINILRQIEESKQTVEAKQEEK